MPKKILLLSISLVSVLLLTGCWKQQASNQPGPRGEKQSAESQPAAEKADSEGSFVGSIKDLLGRKAALECTFSETADGVKTEGIMYTNGVKFRTNVAVEEKGKKTQGYYLSDGEWVYIWDSTSKEGMKMKLEEEDKSGEADLSETTDDSDEEPLDLEKDSNYSCKPWMVSAEMFKVPTDINFVDWGAQMQKWQKAAEDSAAGADNTCDICEMIPDATAKADCKKNSGCK